jgi:hypothetical protein
MADTKACRDDDDQPPTADDENAARLAWQLHQEALEHLLQSRALGIADKDQIRMREITL